MAVVARAEPFDMRRGLRRRHLQRPTYSARAFL
jgi:hypothetical protein